VIQCYFTFLKLWLTSRVDDERGATMVEYGLMIALVALVVGVAAATLGGGIAGLFNKANTSISSAP
jgi:pilus assembly protein Flp/PilA